MPHTRTKTPETTIELLETYIRPLGLLKEIDQNKLLKETR